MTDARLLRAALLLNAGFSLITGALLLWQGPLIAGWLGIGAPALVEAAGVGLLAFAGMVGWLGSRKRPDPRAALAITGADVSWVVGTLLLLVLGSPTEAGVAATLATDLAVLGFAVAQLVGIDRMFRSADRELGAHHVCIEVTTTARPDALWSVISDLGGIARHLPSLKHSSLRDGAAPGVGAVRACESHGGQAWAEACTAWDPAARSFAVEFLAQEPGFPYPFRAMRGGWVVTPRAQGSVVRVWWATRPKAWWHTPLLLPVMEASVRRDFPAVVHSMARAAGATDGPTAMPLAALC